MSRLDELYFEYEELVEARREGRISATAYCIRLDGIAEEYIRLLDEFEAQATVVRVEAVA